MEIEDAITVISRGLRKMQNEHDNLESKLPQLII